MVHILLLIALLAQPDVQCGWHTNSPVVGSAGEYLISGTTEEKYDIVFVGEGFADRGYRADGTLMPRRLPGAVLHDPDEVVALGAIAREESRGSHSRTDFPERDDGTWLVHTLAYMEEDGPRLEYEPPTLGIFEVKERVY